MDVVVPGAESDSVAVKEGGDGDGGGAALAALLGAAELQPTGEARLYLLYLAPI